MIIFFLADGAEPPVGLTREYCPVMVSQAVRD